MKSNFPQPLLNGVQGNKLKGGINAYNHVNH